MSAETILRGGTVIDGSGAAPRNADVVVVDDRIAEVTEPGESASTGQVIDVSGSVVCPGFIDLHSHTDFTIFEGPEAITQATQGVTTLVTGNCGSSPFPLSEEYADQLRTRAGGLGSDSSLPWTWMTAGEYADAVDQLPLGVNLALQVGHSALRIAAMGSEQRAPTEQELRRMCDLIRESADDGVVGFSTGLIYAPGSFADKAELRALGRAAAEAGLLYSTHMRNEGKRLLDAIEEALDVARHSGVRLEISHLKASGEENWGLVRKALDLIERARAEGIDVTTDQYPYTASSTTLTAWLPAWAHDGGRAAMVARLEDPEQARQVADAIEGRESEVRVDRIVLADTPDGPYSRFVGRSVGDAATELGLGPSEAIVELLRGQGGSISIVNHSMSEDDVRHVMGHPLVSVASDSARPNCPGRGVPHPRGFGTFTRVLGHYSRDEGVLELPEAVRKMTGLPASRLGWTDRGVVRAGAVADLAVFDPDRVADTSTFTDPWQLSEGLRYTFIAGRAVLADGEPTGAAPGRVLRGAPVA